MFKLTSFNGPMTYRTNVKSIKEEPNFYRPLVCGTRFQWTYMAGGQGRLLNKYER